MNKEKVKQIVLDIIAEIAPDEDLSDVKPEIRLRDQLDLDSMDFLDIVMELRINSMVLMSPKRNTESLNHWKAVEIIYFPNLKLVLQLSS